MTAWFNYYLHYDTGYHDYLYGTGADLDVALGQGQRQVDTAPRSVRAMGQEGAVLLAWSPARQVSTWTGSCPQGRSTSICCAAAI
jgi:hypothetical protein